MRDYYAMQLLHTCILCSYYMCILRSYYTWLLCSYYAATVSGYYAATAATETCLGKGRGADYTVVALLLSPASFIPVRIRLLWLSSFNIEVQDRLYVIKV